MVDMIKIHAGKLSAIGYDQGKRILRIETNNGQSFEYANISESIWRQLRDSSNQWSYFRDNIEEEYTARPVTTQNTASDTPKKNPLDDLFKS